MGADGRVYISEVDSVEVWGAKLGAKCDIQNAILGGTPIPSRQRTDSTLFAYSDGAISNQSMGSTLFAYSNNIVNSVRWGYYVKRVELISKKNNKIPRYRYEKN